MSFWPFGPEFMVEGTCPKSLIVPGDSGVVSSFLPRMTRLGAFEMILKKYKPLEQVKILYLFIFILGAILVVPAHLFPPPFFMPFRFPHYLEMMAPFLGISWPDTFEIYHLVFYGLVMMGGINILGIFFYPKFRKATIISSFAGILLLFPIILFFFFPFMKVNPPTSIIYGLYSIVLLIADMLTLKVLIKRQKEASR